MAAGALSWLVVGCGGRPPTLQLPTQAQAQPTPSASAAAAGGATPCARAARLRATVAAMRASGELAQALRSLDRADALCPGSAGEGRALQVDTAMELGIYSRARRLAALIDADPRATPEEKRASARARANDAAADYGSGEVPGHLASLIHAAASQADPIEGRRLVSRALVALERAERAQLVADAVGWVADTAQSRPGSWSSDGAWLALHGSEFRSFDPADVITIFDAHTGQPRLRVRPDPAQAGESSELMKSLSGMFDIGPRSLVLIEGGGAMVSIDLRSGESKTARADWRAAPNLPSCNMAEEPAALSAEGDLIAIPWPSGGVRIYRVSTGALLQTLAAPNRSDMITGEEGPSTRCRISGASLLSFSRNGSRLSFASPDGALRVWQPGDARARVVGSLRGPPTGLALSPDGGTLAAAAFPPKQVELFETRTGRRLPSLPLPPAFAAGRQATHSDCLASVGDSSLTFVDLATTPVVRMLPSRGDDTSVAISVSADGVVRVADSESIRSYELGSNQERVALRLGHHRWARAVAVAVSHAAVATLVARTYPQSYELVLTRAGQPGILHVPVNPRYREDLPAGALSFDATGRHLAVLEATAVILVEVASGHSSALPLAQGANAFSFDPSGRTLAVAGVRGGVQLWDAALVTKTRTIDADAGSITALAWSLDGARLVYGNALGALRMVDVATGRVAGPELSLGTGRAVAGLQLDDAGQRLFAVGADLTVRTWDLKRGEPIAEGPPATRHTPFGDPRFELETRTSSLPDAQVGIYRCPSALAVGAPREWGIFASRTADCDVVGFMNGWQPVIGSTTHPDQQVELTVMDDVDAVYLRSPAQPVPLDGSTSGPRAQLLSGEVIAVEASAVEAFSGAAALGSDGSLECRVGRWVFPIETCRSLLLRSNMLSDALSGGASVRDD